MLVVSGAALPSGFSRCVTATRSTRKRAKIPANAKQLDSAPFLQRLHASDGKRADAGGAYFSAAASEAFL